MRAVIILNGDVDAKVAKRILHDDFIIATDGGARHLETLSLHPKAIVGDMDSITKELKTEHQERLIHNDEPDFNDAEKALHLAVKMGFDQIVFVGFEGSRLDHMLATVMLLKEYKDNDLSLLTDDFEARVINDEYCFKTKKGVRVSLIALDCVSGITTKGLKFPLVSAKLNSSTHGVANVAAADEVTVSVEEGSLLLIRWFEEKG